MGQVELNHNAVDLRAIQGLSKRRKLSASVVVTCKKISTIAIVLKIRRNGFGNASGARMDFSCLGYQQLGIKRGDICTQAALQMPSPYWSKLVPRVKRYSNLDEYPLV